MKHYAVVLAGGTGSRTGLSVPKQFAPLAGKPLIAHTLEKFEMHPLIDAIVCVCHPEHMDVMKEILDRFNITRCRAVIPGGETRQESVYNALTMFTFSAADILLVHDAARLFVSSASISAVIEGVKLRGSADLCVPATDTIIETDGKGAIVRIPDRAKLMCVQTPQGFRYDILRKAHDAARARGTSAATDDIGLVLENGETPVIVTGEAENFKVTTARDLVIAEALLSRGI